MTLVGTNTLFIEQDANRFWYLADRISGHYVSPPMRDEAFARNLWSRAEGLLHGNKLTIEGVFKWAQEANDRLRETEHLWRQPGARTMAERE